jgi:hypothetical protein
MLHNDYNRKGSIDEKTGGRHLKGLGAKMK